METASFSDEFGSLSQAQGMSGLDSLAMGNMGRHFPQEQARPSRLMEERDLGTPTSSIHHNSLLQVPLRLPDDHLSLGDLGGRDLAAGPESTRTSYSDPDGSVLGGRFPCRKPWCSKSYKTKSGEK